MFIRVTVVISRLIRHLDSKYLKASSVLKRDARLSRLAAQSITETRIQKYIKLLKRLDQILGLHFFFIKLEGNQDQLIVLSMLFIRYADGYSASIAGLFFNAITILFYGIVTYYSLKNSTKIWRKVKELH